MSPARELRRHATAATRLLKVLAHEARLMILCRLLDGERSAGALGEELGISQSAVSQHLAVLRAAKIVATRREAQIIHYQLSAHEPRELLMLLHHLYCGGQAAGASVRCRQS